MVKRVVSLVVVAALVGGGVWAYLYTQSRGNAPRYRLAPVERGPLTASVSSSGNLNAVITVQVGSQISGQIKELLVDFNSPVRQNQVIARIDPETYEAKVSQARADLESTRAAVINQQAQVERARADVENAKAALLEAQAQTAKARVAVLDGKRDHDRKSELYRRELIAKSEMDTSEAAYQSAVAQVESTRAKEQALAAAIRSSEAQAKVVGRHARFGARPGEAEGGRAPTGPGRSRAHHDPGAGGRRGGVTRGRRRPDGGGQPPGPRALHDRAGPHQDAGGDERRRGRHRPHQARRPCHLHRGRVSRGELRGHRHPDPQGASHRPERRDLHGRSWA